MTWTNALFLFIACGLLLFAWRGLAKGAQLANKKRLLLLLEESERMVSNYRGGHSGNYLSAQEFHQDLKAAITAYKNGNEQTLHLFCNWFAPTCEWDDFVGAAGSDLANEIVELVNTLKKQ